MATSAKPDLLALVDSLNRHEVDYVLVGGMAAVVYGATRPPNGGFAGSV